MRQEKGWQRDGMAWVLLALGLLLTLSVLSHDSLSRTYPPTPRGNLLGPAGGWVAQELYDTLGITVYVLLVAWFVLVLLLLLQRGVLTWSLRLAGWIVLVPTLAVVADVLSVQRLGGPLGGSGGAVGAWMSAWLDDSFPPVIRWVVVGTSVFVGVLLSLDFLLIGVLRLSWHTLRVGFGLPLRWLKRRTSARSRAARKTIEHIPINHHLDMIRQAPPVVEPPPEDAILAEEVPIVRPAPAPVEENYEGYELPPVTLLEEPKPFPYSEHDERLRETAALLEQTFSDFGLNVRVVGINTGPVITQYEIALETGLRVNKVTNLSDDLALNLRVPSVRIVTPIPGKNTVGVEIPNEHRAEVRLKEVILTAGKKSTQLKIPLFLGKDTEGRPLIYDLADMPHLLIAGRTGTGKSVCMNAIILSMLMTRRPDQVKMIMIDPKMLELSEYGKIPHLMHPVVKDMKKAEAILSWAVDKMEERYDFLSRARVRNIAAYNELNLKEIYQRLQPSDDDERTRIPERMPYIVIFVDEMNDLMMTMKREVEGHVIRLAQKSRAAGIHLVVATQKPTVDVITGLIKSNLPARICFQVLSRSDSRVVLDEMGADKLLGKGDMLFLAPGTSTLIRAQGTYASDREITRVVENLECEPCYAQELIELHTGLKEGTGDLHESLRARDELYEQAIEVVVREGRGSVSLLQRALGIGYGRAARLIDFMAEDGIVGPYNGSNAREVIWSPDRWEQMKEGAAS
jgi:S-DNA-T family DNA segregation ATPase FtsK/SpoIIIE